MNKIKVTAIFGTRPEVIKMAPVILEMYQRPDISVVVIITGQHRDMVKQYLHLFEIEPDYDLAIMEKDQTLDAIVANTLKTLPGVLDRIRPDMALVQGDTSSAFAAALAAFHAKVKVGHIEAGLRTGNKYDPYPEEMNRRLIGAVANVHFCPTETARSNLRREGVDDRAIFVTGNTVIDALLHVVRKDYMFGEPPLSRIDFERQRIITVTTHRRESFGAPLGNILKALKEIVVRNPDVEIVLPVHYNPNVRTNVYGILGNIDRIHLCEPLPYELFVQLLNKSYLVLTDSGGVQEEAPSLGKPVLVLRETTERPEGIQAGTAVLVGTDKEQIIGTAQELLDDGESYKRMAQAVNPYGDGKAAIRIVDILERT